MLTPVSNGNTPGGRVRRMRKKILVIEDERDIADLIRLHLRDLNYLVSVARDGNTGLRKSSAGSWDLIILDLRLPGIDGLEICRRLRQKSQYVPILMLTSKSSESRPMGTATIAWWSMGRMLLRRSRWAAPPVIPPWSRSPAWDF